MLNIKRLFPKIFVEMFLETNFFNMLFFLLRALRNSSGILLGSRARLNRLVERLLR